MNIFAPLIRRPIGTSLLACGLLLAGLLAYRLLGVAALPSMDFPGVMVVAWQPGASPQVMASTVLAPLERHLGQIPGIDEMYGRTTEGAVNVMLRFTFGHNVDNMAHNVQAALNAAQADLPSGMPRPPQFFKFTTSDMPILYIALTSDGMSQDKLYDLADTLMRPALAQIPGVAQAEVFGGTPPAVRVELGHAALAAKNLTANDVANVLRAANVTSPQGLLSDGVTQFTVSANDSLQKPEDYANLLVSMKNGIPVHLKDLAQVYAGQEDEYQAAWFNHQRSVGLRISKRADANAVATAEAIRARLPMLAANLPANVTMWPMYDLTATTKSALHEVQVSLLISVLLVVGVMLIFLRRLRPTLIAALTVPLSLAGAFLVMWSLGYTLNTLSLSALVLSIGFVVDDAVVVIENTVRHLEQGESPLDAALKGTREIGFTVISITLSLVAVFAPMLIGNNVIIVLLREFSITLAAAVVVSALVSLSIVPALCGRLFRPEAERTINRTELVLERFDRALLRSYQRALDWALRHRRLMRWQPILLLILTGVFAVLTVKTAGGVFMPDQDAGQLVASIRTDASVSPAVLTERTERVLRVLARDPAIADVLTMLGGDDGGGGGGVGNRASAFAELKPLGKGPGERHENIKDVIARLDYQFKQMGDIEVTMEALQFLNGGGSGDRGGQYEFQLVSTRGEDLQPWALAMVRQMRGMQAFKDVTSNFDLVGQQQIIQINRDAASRLHVNIGDIDSVLYNAFGQRQVSVIYSDLNQYSVVLTASPELIPNPSTLMALRVKSAQGQMIPLSALAEMTSTYTPLRVRHHNQLEAATISYNLADGVTQQDGMKSVEQAGFAAQLPAGIQIDYTGRNQRMQQAQNDGVIILISAIVAMYIVLGILYESLGHPLTILSTLPAAGVGAFLALFITQTPVSLMALIAVLMLIGIVKKNAILMVDFALVAQRERGLPAPQAIREAAIVRFRPITMTTLVAIGAALPLAIGFGVGAEMRQPLGIAIVGGLLVSQLLTLLSTPAIYLWNHDRKERKLARQLRKARKLRARKTAEPASGVAEQT